MALEVKAATGPRGSGPAIEVKVGDHVGLKNKPGAFTVTAIFPDHVELYGGDFDRGGYRQYRAVLPRRLRRLTPAQLIRIKNKTNPKEKSNA